MKEDRNTLINREFSIDSIYNKSEIYSDSRFKKDFNNNNISEIKQSNDKKLDNDKPIKKKKKNRCSMEGCNKKLGVMGFKCSCDNSHIVEIIDYPKYIIAKQLIKSKTMLKN